jgi:hypothetical protein
MKIARNKEAKTNSVRGSFIPVDVEAGKDVFPLAAVGPKQDSITQAHVGKGEQLQDRKQQL